MSIYLAIDAGGTKTDYLLADESRELGRVRGGSIKRLNTSAELATVRLDEALGQLTAETGVAMSAVTRTCIGTAGESVPLVAEWLRAALGERVGGSLLLVGDVEIALDAAFPGEAGVLVLAGTGSNVAARLAAGRLTTVGGWGPVLGDQSSGHQIGLRALRAIFAAIDHAPDVGDDHAATRLLAAVLERWRLAGVPELVEYANGSPAPEFAALTEVVLGCAEAGDAVAGRVLREEGEALAELVLVAIDRVTAGAAEGWLPPVAFAGSVMERVGPVRDAVVRSLRARHPGIEILPGVIDPIAGALWRARSG